MSFWLFYSIRITCLQKYSYSIQIPNFSIGLQACTWVIFKSYMLQILWRDYTLMNVGLVTSGTETIFLGPMKGRGNNAIIFFFSSFFFLIWIYNCFVCSKWKCSFLMCKLNYLIAQLRVTDIYFENILCQDRKVNTALVYWHKTGRKILLYFFYVIALCVKTIVCKKFQASRDFIYIAILLFIQKTLFSFS